MNLFIFNESSQAAVYGIGTYINELIKSVSHSDINLNLVYLYSDNTQILIKEIDGVHHWHFPMPIRKPQTAPSKKRIEQYYRNIVYLLQLYITDNEDLIFHLNYFQNCKLAEELKKAFICKVILTIHSFNWSFEIFDNRQQLRYILNKEQNYSLHEGLKKSVEEEKSLYSKVDHIICLSNYMKEILCSEYGLCDSKISIIPNGLNDSLISISQEIAGQARNDTVLPGLRSKWNIHNKEKIVLFAGRMDEIKGLI